MGVNGTTTVLVLYFTNYPGSDQLKLPCGRIDDQSRPLSTSPKSFLCSYKLNERPKTGYKRAGNESVESYKDVKAVQKAPSNLKPVTPNKTHETNSSIESFSRACAGSLGCFSEHPTHILADILEGKVSALIKRGTTLAAAPLQTVEEPDASEPN